MISAPFDWFYIAESDYRTPAEREFLEAFCEFAPQWLALGVAAENGFRQSEDALFTVAIDVCDEERKGVLRSLRVDFDGSEVLMGEDETMQFVTPLAENCRNEVVRRPGLSPEECGRVAGEWITKEMARPIELREWVGEGFLHRNYVMSDSGEVLSWSDSQNQRRKLAEAPSNVWRVHPGVGTAG